MPTNPNCPPITPRPRRLAVVSDLSARQRLDTPRTSRRRFTPQFDVEAVGRFSEAVRPVPRHRPIPGDSDRLRDRLDPAESVRAVAALGSVPVHPAQPGLLHAGGVRGAADPARAEPPGEPRPGRRWRRTGAAPQQTKADTEYLARELAALRIAVGEVATRDYLRRELEELRDLLNELRPSNRARERTSRARPTAPRSARSERPDTGFGIAATHESSNRYGDLVHYVARSR